MTKLFASFSRSASWLLFGITFGIIFGIIFAPAHCATGVPFLWASLAVAAGSLAVVELRRLMMSPKSEKGRPNGGAQSQLLACVIRRLI